MFQIQRIIFTLVATIVLLATNIIRAEDAGEDDPPNLLVIYTDEHNFRTIGAYREQMHEDQAFQWGKNVKVATPHIDSIAHDGALFTNFYVVNPLCTPSRASFMSGLYPEMTGAWKNHQAMDEDIVTWANVLKRNNYHTGYIGKWHLNGVEKPGFANKKRKFGFTENDYLYNRGHWKFFSEKNGEVTAHPWEDHARFPNPDNYATDFLFGKGIDFVDRASEKKRPFALMMSIPDPHGPDIVRQPYMTMYKNVDFDVPPTAIQAMTKSPALPIWSVINTNLEDAEEEISNLEGNDKRLHHLRQYFGMVKLVDDSVGRILRRLKKHGMYDNTIIVFTSDHGDMMGEHAKWGKGRPFETSAGAPYIVSWPKKIMKGKVVETAYSSIDFAPTILNLMGIDTSELGFHGIDGSDDLLSDDQRPSGSYSRYITDSKQGKWAAAVNQRFKLVLSKSDVPWLYDLTKDPDEVLNYFNHPRYQIPAQALLNDLTQHMDDYSFPLLRTAETIMLSYPACRDSPDRLRSAPTFLCADISIKYGFGRCENEGVSSSCELTCRTCCLDSDGEIWLNDKLRTCSDVAVNPGFFCEKKHVRNFCPVTCGKCRATARIESSEA